METYDSVLQWLFLVVLPALFVWGEVWPALTARDQQDAA